MKIFKDVSTELPHDLCFNTRGLHIITLAFPPCMSQSKSWWDLTPSPGGQPSLPTVTYCPKIDKGTETWHICPSWSVASMNWKSHVSLQFLSDKTTEWDCKSCVIIELDSKRDFNSRITIEQLNPITRQYYKQPQIFQCERLQNIYYIWYRFCFIFTEWCLHLWDECTQFTNTTS